MADNHDTASCRREQAQRRSSGDRPGGVGSRIRRTAAGIYDTVRGRHDPRTVQSFHLISRQRNKIRLAITHREIDIDRRTHVELILKALLYARQCDYVGYVLRIRRPNTRPRRMPHIRRRQIGRRRAIDWSVPADPHLSVAQRHYDRPAQQDGTYQSGGGRDPPSPRIRLRSRRSQIDVDSGKQPTDVTDVCGRQGGRLTAGLCRRLGLTTSPGSRIAALSSNERVRSVRHAESPSQCADHAEPSEDVVVSDYRNDKCDNAQHE
ncbi:hypothetical protein JK358_25480 [Nocardia sp. 2]|uniref:Uncharacterized protein n=1 Tax=Nocardia acididurans TaxID=2802282 RepID=A0ABS1MAU3_9NOCA|nr:hypothetical protein [Nocardia acididurans]MBL1077758.1 hypothetical protein [Nocardia acididurans]